MIQDIKDAAAVGITTFITNSDEKIETQLNRLTKEEELPIALVSWNITAQVAFNPDGTLANPLAAIVMLVLSKPDDRSKDTHEDVSEQMSSLYIDFLQKLNGDMVIHSRTPEPAVSGANFKLVPNYGKGKHSGVLGKFNVIVRLPENSC